MRRGDRLELSVPAIAGGYEVFVLFDEVRY
jgi:hypothetical protein